MRVSLFHESCDSLNPTRAMAGIDTNRKISNVAVRHLLAIVVPGDASNRS